jgi:hypothetical protein
MSSLFERDIAQHRLHNQLLDGNPFERAEDVVRWLGAVQSQDFAGARWALAQRCGTTTSAALDQLYSDGKILRTHVLRPTWHFVAPEDIRWLLALTGPRVSRLMANYNRLQELDEAVFASSNAALARALKGGAHLTRRELAGVLQDAGIATPQLRLGFLVMRAELDAVICSGPRRGNQFTYALLEERAPAARTLHRDEGLAELVRRYFTSHGPAQPRDFAWWSGLTLADARAGLEMVGGDLVSEVIAGQPHWRAADSKPAPGAPAPVVHLLPNYDEYTVGYRDHSAILDRARVPTHSVLGHVVTVDGQVRGGWRRSIAKGEAVVEVKLPEPLTSAERGALERAVARFGRFLRMPVRLRS